MRLLKSQFFEKKALLPVIEKIYPIFSRVIEHKKCQWTIYKGPQCFLTSMVQSIWSFSSDLRSREPNYSKLKLSSRRKTDFGPFFSYYALWPTLSILLLGSTRYLGNYGASYKIFSLGPKRLFKTHIFWKKSIFSVKKCICPMFFRIVESDKPRETNYMGQKDILTIIVEV